MGLFGVRFLRDNECHTAKRREPVILSEAKDLNQGVGCTSASLEILHFPTLSQDSGRTAFCSVYAFKPQDRRSQAEARPINAGR